MQCVYFIALPTPTVLRYILAEAALVSPLLTPLWVKEHLKQPSPDSHRLQHMLLSPWLTASSSLMGWDVPILVCLVLHIWQPGAMSQAVSPFGQWPSPLCVPQLCDWLCSTLSMLSQALPSSCSSAPITSLLGCAP